jgi:hypothetical protein
MFFGEKDPKKDNSPKCKVSTLAHYMSFGPNCMEKHYHHLENAVPNTKENYHKKVCMI